MEDERIKVTISSSLMETSICFLGLINPLPFSLKSKDIIRYFDCYIEMFEYTKYTIEPLKYLNFDMSSLNYRDYEINRLNSTSFDVQCLTYETFDIACMSCSNNKKFMYDKNY